MKPSVLNSILVLTLASALATRAQETNSSAALDWSSFESIAQKNIFDPTRSGRSGNRGPRARAVNVRAFTFCGTVDDVAIFKGDGVPAKGGDLKVGDAINGFKVMKIPTTYNEAPTITLTDPSGTIVVLKQDESMRREEDGPWTKSEQPAPVAISVDNSQAQSDESAAAPAAEPAGVSDILARLRARHKQEEQ
jgi:hypothetical protein